MLSARARTRGKVELTVDLEGLLCPGPTFLVVVLLRAVHEREQFARPLPLETVEHLVDERLAGFEVAQVGDRGGKSACRLVGGRIAPRLSECRDGFLVVSNSLGETAGQLLAAGEQREEPRPFRVARRRQLERLTKQCARGHEVEVERPLAREREEAKRGRLQLGGVVRMTGGSRQFEGGRVVVREHLGDVLDPLARLRLQPGRGGDVAGGARCARKLRVRDVAGQDVPEGVLGLALHRGVPGGTHQLLPRELAQRVDHIGRVAVTHFRDRAGPKDLADHRRIGEQRLALRRQGVQARGDERLDRVRQRNPRL